MTYRPFDGINTDPNHPIALASDEDRLWLEAHPRRFLRLRHPTDGARCPNEPRAEWSPLDAVLLVTCVTDGVRHRAPVRLNSESPTLPFLRGVTHADRDLIPLAQAAPCVSSSACAGGGELGVLGEGDSPFRELFRAPSPSPRRHRCRSLQRPFGHRAASLR